MDQAFDPLSRSQSPQSPPPAPPKANWFGRNWKWAVPVGCLGLCAMFAVFFLGIFMVVFGTLRSSEVVKQAVTKAEAHPEVARRIGTPIDIGWLVSGSINTTGPGGEANLKVPISGQNGKGALYIVAEKKADRWAYTTLEVEVEGSDERIDVLGSGPPADTPDQDQTDERRHQTKDHISG